MKHPTSTFLSLPAPGERTLCSLQKKVRLVALRELLTVSAIGLGRRANAGMNQIQRALQRVARKDAAALLDVVGMPDVQAPLLVMASGIRSPKEILPSLVPNLLVALRTVEIDEALLWEHPFDRVVVEGLGEITIDGGAKAILLDPSGVGIERVGGERFDLFPFEVKGLAGVNLSNPSFALGSASLKLALSLVDTNPLSMEEAHPDKVGNAISLGGKSPGSWVSALEEALNLISLALPDWYAELQHTTQRILPVGFEPEMHLSASYREAPGIVYMTLHPDPLTMAEALIHETQHGKLNLLTWLDPVLDNAYTAWTASPVRPDLRPVMGVLLAVHAFVPVSAFHSALAAQNHPISRSQKFQDRRIAVLAGNANGLDIVQAKAKPTAIGARLIRELRLLHDHLAEGQDVGSAGTSLMPPG